MAEIQPFRGVLYRVPASDLPRVLAPPYDVITAAHRDELYARDPRNVVRVVLSREPGDAAYEDAGRTYRRWLDEGVLAADDRPALYVLEQSFAVESRTLRRYGLVARFRAEDPGRRVILPHEHTRRAAREDRYRVLRATGANFSPIFLMFPDEASRFSTTILGAIAEAPALVFTDEGEVTHRLWRTSDGRMISELTRLLGGVKCYIADGHHRHATALRHAGDVGPDGGWTLGYFTPMGAPGLVVLPYHRILSRGPALPEARARLESAGLAVQEAGDAHDASRRVEASSAAYAFALAAPGGGALVAEAAPRAVELLDPAAAPCLKALDTFFFHEAVLGPLLGIPEEAVSYVHSRTEAEEALATNACRLAAFMRGTPVAQIVDVAEAGESMPAKSTFFHPKLPSGLVIHPLVA